MSFFDTETCSLSIFFTAYSAGVSENVCRGVNILPVVPNHASSNLPSRLNRAKLQAASAIHERSSRHVPSLIVIGASANDFELLMNVVVSVSTPTNAQSCVNISPRVAGYVSAA